MAHDSLEDESFHLFIRNISRLKMSRHYSLSILMERANSID